MSLTVTEIKLLLATVAVLDDVDVDDELTVKAWQEMSEVGGWESYEVARRAVFVYRSEQPNYPLRPGHITQVLERVRARAHATFDPSRERVPDDAANDLDAYKRWVIDRFARHKARVFAGFVAGDASGRRAIEGGAR